MPLPSSQSVPLPQARPSSSQVVSATSPTLDAPRAHGDTVDEVRKVTIEDAVADDDISEYAEDYHDHASYRALVSEAARMCKEDGIRDVTTPRGGLEEITITPLTDDTGTIFYIYQLYRRGEAHGIDVDEVVQTDAIELKVIVVTLTFESEADLDQHRFTEFASKCVERAKRGVVIGLICNHPTETFINTIYRGLDVRDRCGRRDLPGALAKTVEEETCMMKRCVGLVSQVR